MNNIFAGHANSYHGFTFEQALRGIHHAGFRYIELAAVANWTEHVTADMSDEQLEDVKALMKEYDIIPISLSGHCNLMDEKRLGDFEKNIELARKLGCKYIITSTGEAHFGSEDGFHDELLIDNIRKILPALKKNGIVMVIELHGLYCTGQSVSRIVRAIDSEYVGINYDTANVMYFGGISPMDDIKCCVKDVKYVHLKDKIGGKDEWNFPGTGNGKLPLKEFMDYMDSCGYEGVYSIEIEYTQDYCMRQKDQPGDINVADKEMKDSYFYIKSLGRI